MAEKQKNTNGQNHTAGLADDGSLWVFAYGSLIWKPGIPVKASLKATIPGYNRALCVHSVIHRGTHERPGLVLGLAPGEECSGILLHVAAEEAHAAMKTLDDRELVTDVYRVEEVSAVTANGPIQARTYVCDISHDQYAGILADNELVERVHGAVGDQGPNEEYVINSARALEAHGIQDSTLFKVRDALLARMV